MARRGLALGLALFGCAIMTGQARAETVTAAPGITVSKRSYGAAANEEPFYSFREKTPQQRAADAALLAAVDAGPGREAAVQRLLQLGLQALVISDFGEAARRYNQAYLLQPGRAEIYHGLAAVTAGRFGDAAFAEELFGTALKLKPGDTIIEADYARFLLLQKRSAEAVPLLEAVIRRPDAQAMHFSNLGFAYAQTGQNAKACESLAKARGKSPPPGLQNDLAILAKLAAC